MGLGGAKKAPPSPIASLKGPTSKGEEKVGKGERKGRGGKGRGGEGMGGTAPFRKFLDPPLKCVADCLSLPNITKFCQQLATSLLTVEIKGYTFVTRVAPHADYIELHSIGLIP